MKSLQAWVKLGGLKHLFTADDLDPQNSPALVQIKDQIRAMLIAWANDPNGLDRQVDEIVAELRVAFAQKDSRLKLKYAIALPPETPVEH